MTKKSSLPLTGKANQKGYEWRKMIFPRAILHSSNQFDIFRGEKENWSTTIVLVSHPTNIYLQCFGFIKLRMLDEVLIRAKIISNLKPNFPPPTQHQILHHFSV